MKTIIAVFVLLSITFSAQCQSKELRRKKTMTITPQKAVEAAVELFTCSPANPTVDRVEVKEVNGRKTVVPVSSSQNKNSKRP